MTETTTTPGTQAAWEAGLTIIEDYERHLVPTLFEPWGRELVALANPQPGEHVLDVACGTGIVARLAAPLVTDTGSVTGVDSLPPMLAVARDRASGLQPPIEWRDADAASLPLPDESFDVVLCQQGLQFFEDRPAAAREMHRVARPGGRLALSVWRDLPFIPGYAAIAGALERHVPAGAGFVKAVSSFGDAGSLRRLLVDAGWNDVGITVEIAPVRFPSVEEFVRNIIDIAPVPALQQLDESARQAITAEVAEAVPAYVDDAGFTFPMEAHVAVARR